jgi:cytochrome c553
MKMLRSALLLAIVCASTAAFADRMPIPANAPPAFKAECGSCHLAFPPQLLTADDWHRVMATLDHHYGDNASLDEKTRKTIEEFLFRNSASGYWSKVGPAPGNPPRLTSTTWFQRRHHEVPNTVWQDKRVKGAANCAACHPRAEQGSFSEHEVTMPGGRRGED